MLSLLCGGALQELGVKFKLTFEDMHRRHNLALLHESHMMGGLLCQVGNDDVDTKMRKQQHLRTWT